MSERPSYSPARWNRLKHPYYDLTVPVCIECGKGHIPERRVCPDRQNETIEIPDTSQPLEFVVSEANEIIPS